MKNLSFYLSVFILSFSLLSATPVKGQGFRFALITDLHITKDSLAYNDLSRSVRQINNTPDISFVLVTGDLTEEGDRASLQKVKDQLDQLKVKYYIVSGNHETKWSESGSTDFGHIFGSERFKFQHGGYTFLGFGTGPIIRMMDGHVAPQDISWLKEEFSSAKAGTPFVLVTHYPLQDGDVDNWYEVTDLARNYNVKVFLGGHYHSNRMLSYDGIPGILNRSNLRDKADGLGGYSLYDVTNDSIIVYEQKIGQEPRKWGGYSLNEQYYTADNSSYKRPSDSVNHIYPQVKVSWITKIGNTIYSSPVVYKDKVYVGDDAGVLTCLSLKDGKEIWSYKSDNRIVGTPAAENDVVVFGSADKNIYGVDANTGKQIWKYPAREAVLGAVTIENGIAYIGASDHTMRALDIKTGSLVWEYAGVKGYIETRPLLYQDKVIFGAWDNNMYALDKQTGNLLWKWDGGLTRMHFSPAAVWPVAAHGKVFFTAPDRVMTALDANTGETIWRTKESMVRETIGLSADESRLYSKTMQDSVVCYSATSNAPEKIWSVNVAYGYDHAPSMPVEKDSVVFGSTKNGLIFALDAKSGRLLWKHKIGNSLINTVVPLSGKGCVFTSSEGIVGLLNN
ncbi:serine/threonine protein kinase [Dysgonomonas sp. 521]|uniref:outer membrane protein assembly factor BamB family protein n=1 Tax=Dysgonomonas sp. 521 TaxID=2302932 RepID=UPI0013D51A77|nr:PQQ-binding-like beta-propeller repeat protein [Dysgonomonas sp. 521]NDV94530.1 serine/threonine protein kinase [Dysgonomonas sp. 521]